MSVCPFGGHFTFKPLVVTDSEKENIREAVGSPGNEAQPGASIESGFENPGVGEKFSPASSGWKVF